MATMTSPGRAAEGYAKEVFGGTDATTLAQGPTVAGVQAVGGLSVTEIFAAMLVELRAIHLDLIALKEPTGVHTHLANQ